jgi:hypothetical protein
MRGKSALATALTQGKVPNPWRHGAVIVGPAALGLVITGLTALTLVAAEAFVSDDHALSALEAIEPLTGVPIAFLP